MKLSKEEGVQVPPIWEGLETFFKFLFQETQTKHMKNERFQVTVSFSVPNNVGIFEGIVDYIANLDDSRSYMCYSQIVFVHHFRLVSS